MKTPDRIIKVVSIFTTIVAVLLLIKGFWIEGFLVAILGELVDMPQRIAKCIKEREIKI